MRKIDRAKKVFTRSGELWDVSQVIRPHSKDCFVLLSVATEQVHEISGGKFVPCMDMLCMDYYNEELYPNSSHNKKIFKKIAKHKKQIDDLRAELVSFWEDDPEDDWL